MQFTLILTQVEGSCLVNAIDTLNEKGDGLYFTIMSKSEESDIKGCYTYDIMWHKTPERFAMALFELGQTVQMDILP